MREDQCILATAKMGLCDLCLALKSDSAPPGCVYMLVPMMASISIFLLLLLLLLLLLFRNKGHYSTRFNRT